MAFHEVRFPDDISRGARGGPERRTQIVELASGDEERNASWANSRRRYDVAYGIRRADDLAAVVAFFEARNGRLHGFRFKDWGDHKSCLPSGTPLPTDQSVDTGDGTTTAFQLVKRYASGAQSWTRAIANLAHPGGPVLVIVGVDPGDETFVSAEDDDQQQHGDQRRVDQRQDRDHHIVIRGRPDIEDEVQQLLHELEEQHDHRHQKAKEKRSQDPSARKDQRFYCPFQCRHHLLHTKPAFSSSAPVTLRVA